MTTSQTYNFNPSLGEVTLYAYNLCGIRNTAIVQEHMEAARMAANMLLGRWSSEGVNLWAVDLQTIPLVQGQATYSIPTNTITMLDTYVVQNSGGSSINRLILPISRTEYASYPNKTQQGWPTTFWFDRLLAPTVTLWPVPDGNEVSFSYYRLRQIQDANFTSGQTVDVPYLWMEAFAYSLAFRLALIWSPDKVPMLKPIADEAYNIAAEQNVENVATYISPQIQGYYR